MTIILRPEQEKAIQEAIESGVIRSVEDFIETAIGALPHPEAGSREDAVKRMKEFAKEYQVGVGEPVTRKLLHEGHRL